MSGYPGLIKQSVLIFSERANTNARIAATKATSPIKSVRMRLENDIVSKLPQL